MEITEVRVKLLTGRSDRLRAFCSITFDEEFVVHDLRIIDGRKGLFVAMPSRKLTDKCPSCGGKNHLRASYCCECGESLDEDRAKDRDKFHVDVAHPIVTPCREKIKDAVLSEYKSELEERGILEEEIDSEEKIEEEITEEKEEEIEEKPAEEGEEEEQVEEVEEEEEKVQLEEVEEYSEEEQDEEEEEIEEPELEETPEEEEEDQEEEQDSDKKSGGFGEGIL